jgi:hypothetical protein
MQSLLTGLRSWPARRWWFALGTAVVTFLVIALPTALIQNPVFGREIPPTWWSMPVAIVSSILAGLVSATYVATPATEEKQGKLGVAGGIMTFFAVGCPVCNKLVLLALGTTGALKFFAPVQGYLAVVAIALLTWAFVARVRRENSCRLPASSKSPDKVASGR